MKISKKYLSKLTLFLMILLSFNTGSVHASEIAHDHVHNIENTSISTRALICCDNPIKKTTYTGYIRGYDYLCYSTPLICYMRDYTKYKNVDCTNCGARLSSEVYDKYSTHTNPNHAGWDD